MALPTPLPDAAPSWHVLDLPHAPEAARRTCAALRDDLGALGVPTSVLNDAIIVAGELVTNAVEHGRARDAGTIEVAWLLAADSLQLRVVDAGEGPDIPGGTVSADGLRGRGLAMVAAICAELALDRSGCTTFTARIPL
ncbi:ATP-binding protein [Nocardioides sp. CPCC 205120]|uniref:ATP-binding protein n=1 Tax=Nocardioides sp. CPCC 205120 TaxID=3406462 RepID=UPI003B50E3A0